MKLYYGFYDTMQAQKGPNMDWEAFWIGIGTCLFVAIVWLIF